VGQIHLSNLRNLWTLIRPNGSAPGGGDGDAVFAIEGGTGAAGRVNLTWVDTTGSSFSQSSQGIITDALTHTTTYDLDTQGRMLARHNPAGDSLIWQRDSNGMVTASIDGNGYTTTRRYDAYGQLTSQVVPNGSSITYTRDHSTAGVFYDRVTLAVENGARAEKGSGVV
jgi:YD repeat-containing protein